jgi:hypothetical protein
LPRKTGQSAAGFSGLGAENEIATTKEVAITPRVQGRTKVMIESP